MTDRRGFLRTGALASAAAAGLGRGDLIPGRQPPARALPDPALLRALAATVLPSRLGDEAVEQAVRAFETWIAGYEPAYELNHGYGTHEIFYGPADPAPRWRAQLEAMDIEARKRAGRGLTELTPAERREYVERALGDAEGALPSPARADHVALGLLAHWTASTGAHDLAYRARIGRRTCRGLASLGEPPRALDGEEGGGDGRGG